MITSALLRSRSWNQISLTGWNFFTQTKQPTDKKTFSFSILNCLLIGSCCDFTPHLLVTFIVGAGDFFRPFTINTMFKGAAFVNVLLARLGSDLHAETSPTLHQNFPNPPSFSSCCGQRHHAAAFPVPALSLSPASQGVGIEIRDWTFGPANLLQRSGKTWILLYSLSRIQRPQERDFLWNTAI